MGKYTIRFIAKIAAEISETLGKEYDEAELGYDSSGGIVMEVANGSVGDNLKVYLAEARELKSSGVDLEGIVDGISGAYDVFGPRDSKYTIIKKKR